MTLQEELLQYKLDHALEVLDTLINTLFSDVDGEVCFMGAGDPIPLDEDDANLVIDAFELVEMYNVDMENDDV